MAAIRLRWDCVLCFGVIAALLGSSACAEMQAGSVVCKSGECVFSDRLDMRESTDYGTYNNTLMTTGWGILDIRAGYGRQATNNDLMFAAGFLEGVFTARQIYDHFQNIYFTFFSDAKEEVVKKVQAFLREQDRWMRAMIQEKGKDPFWRHMGYIIAQYDGLMAGYQDMAMRGKVPKLDVFAFQVLNGAGDLIDLTRAVAPETIPDWSKMSKSKFLLEMARSGHCSALVKVLGAYENVFMSHSTWFTYAATMRIFKHYDFNVLDPATAAKRISFSSYPGFLESLDDFYLLGSGMVMLQTTIGVYNKTLYKYVKPQSLLAWHRVRLASMMANSGGDWAAVVAQFNSGTYNNQYMVIDLKRIKLKEALLDGALWVVEQIPTLVQSGDQTPILRAGYWPSYNVPFFEDVYNKSGLPDIVKDKGYDASYQLAPRAKIFRRDEGTVKDMATMKNIMRYNAYKEDPYSEQNPCKTICCRGDLFGTRPFGCYDTKVSDYFMALNFTADIINGPTRSHGLPPFKWTSQFNVSHQGLPDVYDFPFITTAPRF